MTIHTLYIFDRGGSCIYYKEWLRTKKSGLPQEEEFKLMYGMIFSIKSFVQRMSPSDMRDGFLNFKTSKVEAKKGLSHKMIFSPGIQWYPVIRCKCNQLNLYTVGCV